MNNCNYCGEYLGMKNGYYSVKVRNVVFKYCKESCMEKDAESQVVSKGDAE